MYPLFCSYYTDNMPYNLLIKQLEKSLKKFNLNYVIKVLDNKNSWVLNVAQKAKFIQKVYNDNPELPICWIDADGELIRKPFFFKNFNYDFAILMRYGWDFNGSQILFGRTKIANILLKRWVYYCEKYPYVWDQVSLGYAWWDIKLEYNIKTFFIDEKYFKKKKGNFISHLKKIFDKDLIFYQKQASRVARPKNSNKEFTTNDVPFWWRDAMIRKKVFHLNSFQKKELISINKKL